MSSAIIKQLETFKAAAEVSAAFDDLISVETLAEMTKKSVIQVKRLCDDLGIQATNRFGKSYLYSKKQFIEATRLHTDEKLHANPNNRA
jgi:hypothetical protein